MTTIDQYTLGRTLGEGVSAKVKEVTGQDGTKYAMKIFDLSKQRAQKQVQLLLQEWEMAKRVECDYTTTYIDFKENAIMQKPDGRQTQVAYLLLELVDGGELFDYVANTGRFSEEICRVYFKQMLVGINQIHRLGIAHRDLKPENILLSAQQNYSLKIIDFGFSKALAGETGTGFMTSMLGTPGYMAPEIAENMDGQTGQYQGAVIDLFSIATILYILHTGKRPFSEAVRRDPMYKLIADGKAREFWQRQHTEMGSDFQFSEEFMDLLTQMFQYEPHQRLELSDLVQHPWMQGEHATQEDLVAEFQERHQKNKAMLMEEQQNRPGGESDDEDQFRDLDMGDTIYLRQDEEETQAHKDSGKKIVTLSMKTYQGEAHPKFSFFSTFEPDTIFKLLLEKLGKNGDNPQIPEDAKTWKIRFECEVPVHKDDADQDMQKRVEKCTIQVDVMKVENRDDIKCVQFKRKAGSSFLFYTKAAEIIGLMEACNNTLFDEEENAAVNSQAAQH